MFIQHSLHSTSPPGSCWLRVGVPHADVPLVHTQLPRRPPCPAFSIGAMGSWVPDIPGTTQRLTFWHSYGVGAFPGQKLYLKAEASWRTSIWDKGRGLSWATKSVAEQTRSLLSQALAQCTKHLSLQICAWKETECLKPNKQIKKTNKQKYSLTMSTFSGGSTWLETCICGILVKTTSSSRFWTLTSEMTVTETGATSQRELLYFSIRRGIPLHRGHQFSFHFGIPGASKSLVCGRG